MQQPSSSVGKVGEQISIRKLFALAVVVIIMIGSVFFPGAAGATTKCRITKSRWPEKKFVYETDVYLVQLTFDLRGCDIPGFKIKGFWSRRYEFPPPVLPNGGGYWIEYNYGATFECRPDTLCAPIPLRIKHPAIERARYTALFVFPSLDGKGTERLALRHDCTSAFATASCDEV